MLTTLQDWPLLDTAHITWCSDVNCVYPSTFIFPPWGALKNTSVWTTTLLSYVNDIGSASAIHIRGWGDRSDTMIERLMPFHWNQVTWSWLKPMPTRGRGKWRTSWRRNCTDWSARLLKASLPTSWKNQQTVTLKSPPQKLTFSVTKGTRLCMVMQAKWVKCTTTTLEEQSLEGSETEEAPQSANCLPLAQHQTDETPLGWVNRKLCAFLWMFSRASLLDQGWNVWCRRIRGVWKSTLVFWWWRYWSPKWGLKDMTGHDHFDPTSLCSGDCKLITLGVWNGGARPCINF